MIVRTYYVKGLLFYISNIQDSAFIAVHLAEGQVSVVYSPDMQLVATIDSSADITDGAWHSVSLFAFFSFSGPVNKEHFKYYLAQFITTK